MQHSRHPKGEGDGVVSTTESSSHELLLRLAGRLPDRQLWRYRDWLASGALPALGSALPLTLLGGRIGLTPTEFGLLVDSLLPAGADPSRVNSISEIEDADELRFSFSATSAEQSRLGDSVPGLLVAVLGHRQDVGDVFQSWRRPRSADGPVKRILLVDGCTRPAQLTGELQRLLRALGEREPSIEVLGAGMEVPAYHRAALDAAQLICPCAGRAREQLLAS